MGKGGGDRRGFAAGGSSRPKPASSAARSDLAGTLLHAMALIRQGRLQDAESLYRQLLAAGVENDEILCNLAVICGATNRWEEVIHLCEQLLNQQPDHLQACTNLAAARLNTGSPEAAIALLRRAIRIQPTAGDAHINLGKVLEQTGALEEALHHYQEGLRHEASHGEGLRQVGVCLRKLGRLDEATLQLRHALSRNPDAAETLGELAITLYEAGDLQAAINAYQETLRRRPDEASHHSNLGIALVEKGSIREAIRHFEHAIAFAPDNPEHHYNSSMAYLYLESEYHTGWQRYEWRSRLLHNPIRPDTIPPGDIWDGTPLSDADSLLVVSEQGFGDTLQFMRYVKHLRATTEARISICAPSKLHGLIVASGVSEQPLTPQQASQHRGAWIPMMTLPGRLGVTPADVLWSQPYIHPAPQLVRRWAEQLNAEQRPLIAIHWQGNPDHENTVTRGRSLPLQCFSPLLENSPVSLLSLQKGFGSEQLQSCCFRDRFVSCQDLIDATWDFHETAAIIANCDLVITSDSAVAHLAAGMGRTTWLLLKKVPEWRWGLEGERSFWYPSMRLFRQQQAGDWQELMQRVASALRQFCGGPATVGGGRSVNAEILAPISLGELIDKITILELKRQHLSGQALQHVTSELVALTSTLKRLRIRLKSQHLTDLRKVNATLWRIEDEIREMER